MKSSLIVAFQGEHGAFSEEAARHYFPSTRLQTLPLKTFDDVFRSVQNHRSPFGIVPIENSLFGSIHQNYDLLERFPLFIVGEIKLRVVHALLVNYGITMKNFKFIYSHPQAIGQCEKFLSKLNDVEVIAEYDTAGAAKMIREQKRTDAAAIASRDAAKIYNLKILKSGIESDHRNFTRFLILSRKRTIARRKAKTSIIFSMKNIPGALFKALSVFALRDIDLHKIESRPLAGKPWEYLFYLDFAGSIRDKVCSHALSHLQESTSFLKILGSYPQGKTIS
jgi:prephenate dehydratase